MKITRETKVAFGVILGLLILSLLFSCKNSNKEEKPLNVLEPIKGNEVIKPVDEEILIPHGEFFVSAQVEFANGGVVWITTKVNGSTKYKVRPYNKTNYFSEITIIHQ